MILCIHDPDRRNLRIDVVTVSTDQSAAIWGTALVDTHPRTIIVVLTDILLDNYI